jgi:hypothetical protein
MRWDRFGVCGCEHPSLPHTLPVNICFGIQDMDRGSLVGHALDGMPSWSVCPPRVEAHQFVLGGKRKRNGSGNDLNLGTQKRIHTHTHDPSIDARREGEKGKKEDMS